MNVSYHDKKRQKYGCVNIVRCDEMDSFTLARTAEIYGVEETPSPEISFSLRSAAIKDDTVLLVMRPLIERLYAMAIDGEKDIPNEERCGSINISSFMSSYLISSHPTQVFESMGSIETKLVLKAKIMLQFVESMRRNILSNMRMCLQLKESRGLHEAVSEYMLTFIEWKKYDEKKLMTRISHEFEAFLHVEQELGDDEPDTLHEAVQLQKRRLIATACRISGPEALVELEAIRRHVMGNTGNPLETIAKISTYDDMEEYKMSSILPSSLTDEELTHEVLLDEALQLNKNGRPASDRPIYSKIRDHMEVAHWRSLEDDLNFTEPLFKRCMDVMSEIKANIDGLGFPALTGSKYPLFDMEVVCDELSSCHVSPQYTVTWDRYIQVIRCISDGVVDAYTGHHCPGGIDEWTAGVTIMAITSMKTALTSNIKDMEKTCNDKVAQVKCFIQALQFLSNVAKGLCIMGANVHIRGIVSLLKNLGPEHLLNIAEKRIECGEMILSVTTSFIRDAIECEVASTRINLQDLIYNNVHTTAAYNHIVTVVVVSAFLSPKSLVRPETLLLDHERLRSMRCRFDLHTFVVAALGVVNICMKERKIGHAVAILQELGVCLMESVIPISNTDGRINEMVIKLSLSLSEDDTTYIKNSLLRNLANDSLVLELTSTRMKTIVFESLRSNVVNTLHGLIPCVIATIGDELRMHMKVLRQVLRVNLAVYATHYNRIIQETACSMNKA